ncbi:hypothetical protein BK367_03225 [Escherichia coli]|nr:hypothetical protein BK338_18875 [Escherichia coli]OJP40111.1 hypothetical protein BK339_02410 [Escherichia coli]OJQ43547.1 hypothetical protein BK361_22235 [Escherichia coli]OJQ53915.1 hypothetical protein BK362_15905 [Escherichia coli]OJQ59283.1 hypothetical protein BK365_17565 [Escherichia coli]
MPCFTAMRAEIALMSGSAFAVTHHAFSSGAGRTSDGNGSHASTLKSPSYTKSVSWQHYHRIAHYIYYLATDNIRIITHDDTVLLLRGTRNLLKVSTTKNPAKIKEAALLHICGKSTFREYCSTLAGAGVFRWVTDVNHNKRSYYAIDNTLLYIEDVENNKPLI